MILALMNVHRGQNQLSLALTVDDFTAIAQDILTDGLVAAGVVFQLSCNPHIRNVRFHIVAKRKDTGELSLQIVENRFSHRQVVALAVTG